MPRQQKKHLPHSEDVRVRARADLAFARCQSCLKPCSGLPFSAAVAYVSHKRFIRGFAATPPLFLVGTLGVCRKQVGFLAPGSSRFGPSRGVFRRLQWHCRMAPHGQWRDRAGFAPDFPIKLSRAPVFRRIHLCRHLTMRARGCPSAIVTISAARDRDATDLFGSLSLTNL
jgi:hypothetical protein